MNVNEALRENMLKQRNKAGKEVLVEELNDDRVDEAYVDADIADLVRNLNHNHNVLTRESCSGTFSDHFDLESLKQDVTFEELSRVMTEGAYVSPTTPYTFLSIEAFMHSFNDDGSVRIEDANEFYVAFSSALSVDVDGLEEEFGKELTRGLSCDVGVEPRLEYYTFSVPVKTDRYMLRQADSFSEYDRYTREILDTLEEAVVAFS